MKTLIKFIVLFLFSVIAIYFLLHQKIIDINALKNAFNTNKSLILLIAIIQISVCLFMTLRYFSLLKIFKIKTDFQNVLAATFVSNGVGQWMPGSMAFIEVIRIGLMLGADKHLNQKNLDKKEIEIKENLAELALKSKLAAVSIIDRLIGILVMLGFGLIVSSFIYYQISSNLNMIDKANSLKGFLVLTLLLFIAIIMLPFLSKSKVFRKILSRFERLFLALFKKGFLNKIIRKLFHEINSLLDAIVLGSSKLYLFWKPVFYSIMCVLLSCLGLYLSSVALSNKIPFEVILATISILSIASLLPIGIAGVGGMQIIAAIVFSLFLISPQAASSSQLLQTSVNLLAVSAVGILFARLSAKQIRAILLSRKNQQLIDGKKTSDITDV